MNITAVWNQFSASRTRSTIRRFVVTDDGPTAVEYAVMLMLVFLAVILVVRSIGISLNSSFDSSRQAIESAVES